MLANDANEVVITPQSIELLANLLSMESDFSEEHSKRFFSESEYLPFVRLANEQWLMGAVIEQLNGKNLWSSLPKQLQEYLNEIGGMYRGRGQAAVKEIALCVSILAQAGIRSVLLKGAASILNGTYAKSEERFMVDIDLLIDPKEIEHAFQHLKAHGYQESSLTFDIHPQQHHHLPPLVRSGSTISVELHRQPVKQMEQAILTLDDCWQCAQNLDISEQAHGLQLAPIHQLILAIVHSEISDGHYEKNDVNLRQLHNIYRIAKYYHKEIDWQQLEQHFTRFGYLELLDNMLYRLKVLFGYSTPITKAQDHRISERYRQCIHKFCYQQGRESYGDLVLSILRGYQASTILYLYGNQGGFPLLTGRLKHAKRHILMFFSSIFGFFR